MGIKSFVLNCAAKVSFKMTEHAPELLVVGGVIGGVAAGGLACRATYKIKDDIEVYKYKMEELEEDLRDEDIKFDEKAMRMEKRELTFELAKKMAKAYGIPFALALASIAAILYGHNMRNKRYLAMAAAFMASQADYKGLLDRIKRDYGEEEMQRLKYDIKEVTNETEETDEDGNVVGERVEAYKKATTGSLYSRVFDDLCPAWQKSPVMNMKFLLQCQEMANKTLEDRGFITLNEVYAMLGFHQNPILTEAGWVKGAGDGYVSFGIFDGAVDDERKAAFINGCEPSIMLDFNCLGNIRKAVLSRYPNTESMPY